MNSFSASLPNQNFACFMLYILRMEFIRSGNERIYPISTENASLRCNSSKSDNCCGVAVFRMSRACLLKTIQFKPRATCE